MADQNLQQMLDELRENDPRKAAEVAYALAHLSIAAGDLKQAERYGHESIRLFDKYPMESISDCAAQHTVLGGIAIPSVIHQDVVRDRLRNLQL